VSRIVVGSSGSGVIFDQINARTFSSLIVDGSRAFSELIESVGIPKRLVF
jgi:hypothetical protein